MAPAEHLIYWQKVHCYLTTLTLRARPPRKRICVSLPSACSAFSSIGERAGFDLSGIELYLSTEIIVSVVPESTKNSTGQSATKPPATNDRFRLVATLLFTFGSPEPSPPHATLPGLLGWAGDRFPDDTTLCSGCYLVEDNWQ